MHRTMSSEPESRVRAICKLGHGFDCCRYLIADGSGFHCAKHSAALAAELDRRVAAKTMTARADNCPGYALEHVLD